MLSTVRNPPKKNSSTRRTSRSIVRASTHRDASRSVNTFFSKRVILDNASSEGLGRDLLHGDLSLLSLNAQGDKVPEGTFRVAALVKFPIKEPFHVLDVGLG